LTCCVKMVRWSLALLPAVCLGFGVPPRRWQPRVVAAFPGGDGPPSSGVAMDPSLKLALSLLIDLVGMSSFAAPGLGETTDVAWAPVSALLVNYLYGNGVFTSLAFVEELLPGLDFIPTATLAWAAEYFAKGDPVSVETDPEPPIRRRRTIDDDAIDVTTD